MPQNNCSEPKHRFCDPAAISFVLILLAGNIATNAQDFRITSIVSSNAVLTMNFPGSNDSFYFLRSASSLSGPLTSVNALLGTNGNQSFRAPVTGQSRQFYRVQKLPQTSPNDEDHDGIPDAWELQRGLNPLDPADASQVIPGDTRTWLQSYQYHVGASGQVLPHQVLWQAAFGGTNDDTLIAATPTSDGGFILGGYSSSGISGSKTNSNPGGSSVPIWWVVKTDKNGSEQWERTFGGNGIDSLNAIALATNGDYILAGYSSSGISGNKTVITYGDRDYWLMRLDPNGNMLWQTNFGGTNTDYLETMQPTSDGGCILGGFSYSAASGNKSATNWGSSDYWLVKVDATGHKQWDRSYGGSAAELLGDHCLQQTADGGYIVAGGSLSGASGNKTNLNFGGRDIWILKLDSNGFKAWEKGFGGPGDEDANAVRQTADGGYVILGWSTSGISSNGVAGNKTTPNYGGQDLWILKLDANGNKQWERDYGGTNDDYVGDIQQTSDGGYLVGATTSSSATGTMVSKSHGGKDFWLLKLDPSGYVIWESTYGGTADDELVTVQTLPNEGILLAGRSQSSTNGNKTVPGYGARDYWIIRLSPGIPPNTSLPVPGFLHENWRKTMPTDIPLPQTSGPVLAASPDGSLYSCGVYQNTDLIIERLDSSGVALWKRTFHDTRALNSPRSIQLFNAQCDLYGNLLISAKMGNDHVLLAYALTGSVLWQSRVPYSFSPFDSPPVALLSGTDGMTFLCYPQRVFAFDSQGSSLWQQRMQSPLFTNGFVAFTAKLIDSTNLVVAGSAWPNGRPTPVPAMTAISISSGALGPITPALLAPDEESDLEIAYWQSETMSLDSTSNFYALIRGNHPRRLACFKPDGTIAWASELPDDTSYWRAKVVVDERDQCVYVFGSDQLDLASLARLYKVSLNGSLQWATNFGNLGLAAGYSDYTGGTCVLDGNRGVVIVGQRRFPVSSRPPPSNRQFWFLQRISSDGQLLEDRTFWEHSYTDGTTRPSDPDFGLFSAAAMPDGTIVVAHRFGSKQTSPFASDTAADLVCLKPSLEHHAVAELGMATSSWQVGTMIQSASNHWVFQPLTHQAAIESTQYDRFVATNGQTRAAFFPGSGWAGPLFSSDQDGRFLLPPRQLALRVMPGERSVLRWTAPRTGQYIVSGLFYTIDSNLIPGPVQQYDLPRVAVLQGTNQISGTFYVPSTSYPFSATIQAKAGDTVDFVVFEVASNYGLQFVGLQAEVAVPNLPPTIELKSAGSLVWSNQVATANITVAIGDPEGQSAQAQFFLDGKLISPSGGFPSSLSVTLSPGQHVITARAIDQSGLATVSSPLTIDVPSTPPQTVVVPAAEVQQAFYVSAFGANMEKLRDTKYGHGLRFLLIAAQRFSEEGYAAQDPAAFQRFLQEYLNALDQLTRNSQFKETSTGRVAKTSSSTLERGSFTRQELDDLLFSVFKMDPSVVIKDARDRLSNEIGYWIDKAADDRDWELYGFPPSQPPAVRQAVDNTVGNAIGVKTSDSTAALANQLASINSAQAETLKSVASLVTVNGEIRADLGSLKQLFQDSIGHVESGIASQLAASSEIIQSQNEIYSFLTNQAAQARLAQQQQEAQREYDNTIKGAQSAVHLLSKLIGFGDADLGQKFEGIGNGLITIADSINKLSQLDSVFSAGALAASGNIIGAVMSIVSLFGSSSGPTPEQMILTEIGNLKKMLQNLADQMHERFDRVDAELAQIYSDFSLRFEHIDFQIGVLQSDLQTLQGLTLDLGNAIARVDSHMQELFQAEEARRFTDLVLELEEYEAGVLPMTSDEFTKLVRNFYQAATSNAVDAIASPWVNRSRNAPDIAGQLTGTNDNLTANLNYLNAIVLENGWMGGPGLADGVGTLIPSSAEWESGADGIIRLFKRWPQLARSNPFYLTNRLAGVMNSGVTLRTALERITLLRPANNQWQTNALWGYVIQNYRNKGNQFMAALRNFETNYLVGIAQGDLSRQPYLGQVDLWGPVDQASSYIPHCLTIPVPPLMTNGQLFLSNTVPIDPPANTNALVGELPEISLLELLEIQNWAADYEAVSFTSEQTRCSGWLYDMTTSGGTTEFGQAGNLKEGIFNLTLTLRPSSGPAYSWSYSHPKRHFFGIRLNPGGTLVMWTAPPSGQWGPEWIQDLCGGRIYRTGGVDSWDWHDWSSLIDRFWKGGYEPVQPQDRVDSIHLISSVRQAFATAAILQNSSDDIYALQGRTENSLRSLQANYLQAASGQMSSPGSVLGAAAFELWGARELLRVFVELGLPTSYQQNDVLRALFTGSDRLPDLPMLISFCNEEISRSQTAATHTSRPDFDALINSRLAALETVITDRLADIQATGQAEILPEVSDMLNNLELTQQSVQQPLLPFLLLQSVGPSHATFTLLGEDYIPYSVQWSTNLIQWVPLPGQYTNGSSLLMNFGPGRAGFLRVSGQ